jgi:hypothetical protein
MHKYPERIQPNIDIFHCQCHIESLQTNKIYLITGVKKESIHTVSITIVARWDQCHSKNFYFSAFLIFIED